MDPIDNFSLVTGSLRSAAFHKVVRPRFQGGGADKFAVAYGKCFQCAKIIEPKEASTQSQECKDPRRNCFVTRDFEL